MEQDTELAFSGRVKIIKLYGGHYQIMYSLPFNAIGIHTTLRSEDPERAKDEFIRDLPCKLGDMTLDKIFKAALDK